MAALPLKITLLGRDVCFHIGSLLGDSPLKSVMATLCEHIHEVFPALGQDKASLKEMK